MNHFSRSAIGMVAVTLLAGAYAFPWQMLGIDVSEVPLLNHSYKLGLDLNGGVELDYRIDFSLLDEGGQKYQRTDVEEGLKSIIEKRVNSLGTAEPTIQTARYGNESHIVVQIPTQRVEGATEEERRAKNREYIDRAKDTIGKVVRLEFKERKAEATEADRAERRAIADKSWAEMSTIRSTNIEMERIGCMASENAENIKAACAAVENVKEQFATLGRKYHDLYENVAYVSGTGTLSELPAEVKIAGIADLKNATLTGVVLAQKAGTLRMGTGTNLESVPGDKGYAITLLMPNGTKTITTAAGTGTTNTSSTASGTTKQEAVWAYQTIFVNEKPSEWMPAKVADGRVLNEQYLTRASMSFSQGFQPQVDLLFNDAGAKIFGELTSRLVGKEIAIFVGGELLTNPTVQTKITDGHAVINGSFTADAAKKLATDINTGIVPAPIYLTSERSIDAKIGSDALRVISIAGAIGLALVVIFMVVVYRTSGLVAGIALVSYAIFMLALVKGFGIVLTLASIAGIVLSIGLAIDANILIFERTREELAKKAPLERAILVGFERSWSAIWDSHITSFTSAVILFIFGVNLIKGFGLMLGIGIILSLFTAMYLSRIFVLAISGCFAKRTSNQSFIGIK